MEFLDINPTLPRIVGWPQCKNPWKAQIPTLTSNSVIIARYAPCDEPNSHWIRALHGKTLFALGGWTSEMWAEDTTASILEDHDLLTSLAGNMFSVFAFTPAFMVTLSLAGASRSSFRSEHMPSQQVADAEADTQELPDTQVIASQDSEVSDDVNSWLSIH